MQLGHGAETREWQRSCQQLPAQHTKCPCHLVLDQEVLGRYHLPGCVLKDDTFSRPRDNSTLSRGERGVIQRSDGTVEIVDNAKVGEENLLIHDEQRKNPSLAFGLSRLAHGPSGPLPIGVFRNVERSSYDELMTEQLEDAKAKRESDLHALLHAGDTWQIG